MAPDQMDGFIAAEYCLGLTVDPHKKDTIYDCFRELKSIIYNVPQSDVQSFPITAII